MTTHDILALLWRGTLTSSAAICLVLALRLPVRRWLGAQAAYLLWVLVPFAAAAVWLPAPARPLLAVLQVAPGLVAGAPTIAVVPAPTTFDPQPWLFATWLFGALVALAALVWQQRRYLRALGPLVASADGALRAGGAAGSPALVGALFPRIVLPADFEARFDARERELVLAHERAHLGHGDAQINALVALLRCLQWFNPLFHFAASRLRIDQELACDARVIARFPEARRCYADAMLKAQLVGEARQELRLPAGCYWPSSHPLKERIAMLKFPMLSTRRRVLANAAVATLTLAAGYASWAAQPGQGAPAKPPQVSEPPAHVDATQDITATSRDAVAKAPQQVPKIMLGEIANIPPAEDITFRRMKAPKYPAGAVKAGIGANVIVKVMIDEQGKPKSAVVEKLDLRDERSSAKKVAEADRASIAQEFRDVSTAAAMSWTYNPGKKDGKPVGGYFHFPIDFSLHDCTKDNSCDTPTQAAGQNRS